MNTRARHVAVRNAAIGIMTALGVVLTVTHAPAAVLFSDGFESRAPGTINGQSPWTVPFGTPSEVLVVNNAAIAYEGSKYLAIQGGGYNAARANVSAPIAAGTNDLFSFATRFDNFGVNGLQIGWIGNDGAIYIARTYISSTGLLGYFNNANVVTPWGPSISTGVWYRVREQANLGATNIHFLVTAASNGAVIIETNFPMTSLVVPFNTWALDFTAEPGAANSWLVDNVMLVPEPSTLLLLLGAGGLLVWRRRKTVRV